MSPFERLRAPGRQAASLKDVAHRPWPLPAGGWLIGQTWRDLLFAHWRVPAETLGALVPEGLEVDTFDGSAWLGIAPFRISSVRLRGTWPVPRLSSLVELNVRTYVTRGGEPGVFFFSLDASSGPAVAVARRFFRLPYFRARMSLQRRGARVVFSSERTEPGAFPRAFRARYQATGPAFRAKPGSVEHFLVERYRLYTSGGGSLWRADIHHTPWPLQPAEVAIGENTMVPRPVELPDEEPLAHFVERLDVLVWGLARVD